MNSTLVLMLLQVSSCDVCQKVNCKLTTTTPELHPIPVKSPWFHVAIDFISPITPISSKGNRYILTISDYFSKFINAIPLPDKSSAGVVKSLHKVCKPSIIISCSQWLNFCSFS